MSKIFVDQVDPKTATTLTLGTSGDTVDIPSGVTLSGAGTITASAANLAASGAGGVTGTLPIANGGTAATTLAGAGLVNTPAFEVSLSGDQSIANDGTATKITFDTEAIDSDGKFASNKFTPTVAGTYFISLTTAIENGTLGTVNLAYTAIYKNGSVITASDARVDFRGNPGRGASVTANTLVVLDDDDYIEGYAFNQSASGTANIKTFGTRMGGYKLIGA